MRKITKLTMVATLGLAIASAALVFNPVKTEAKTTYVTTKAAGKKIAALQKKAYKSKKKVSISFKFKAKSPSAFKKEAYKKAAKLQWGKAYRSGRTNSITHLVSFNATSNGVGSSWKATKVKTGVYSCKLTINGNLSRYRTKYRNDEARKTMINRITEITKGMNQFDKFYVTACWVECYATYYDTPNPKTSDYDFMKGRYCGVCADMADVLACYAKWAGVKNVGAVVSWKDNHAWCYLEVDGTKYYFDPGSGDPRVLNRKEALEALDYHRTAGLDFANDWYRENIDIEAKDFTNNKAFWDSLTAEQKKAFEKYNGGFNERAKYWLTCDSYSKTELLPAKLFKEERGIEEKVSRWGHQRY